MKLSSRAHHLPLILATVLVVHSFASAQIPIQDTMVYLGMPDGTPFAVPGHGDDTLPLWFTSPVQIGGGILSFVILDTTIMRWRGLEFRYPWENGWQIDSLWPGMINITFFPQGEYPIDTLLHLADLQFEIDADSEYYGETLENISLFHVLFADTLGNYAFIPIVVISPLCIECQTGADEPAPLPVEFVHSAYPNPFNSSVAISFTPPRAGDVTLSIYDVAGRRVKELFRGYRSAGTNRFMWDATDDRGRPAASGTYFYRIAYDDKIFASRVTLQR